MPCDCLGDVMMACPLDPDRDRDSTGVVGTAGGAAAGTGGRICSWLGRPNWGAEVGGAGAGRWGGVMVGAEVGGFGAGLLGSMPFADGLLMLPTELAGKPLGMGGGARGFSKLCSWFCGKRGLCGGDSTAAGVNGPALTPAVGVVPPCL